MTAYENDSWIDQQLDYEDYIDSRPSEPSDEDQTPERE